MNVAQVVVKCLEQLGVKRIYGLIGTSILDFIDAVRDSGLRYISTRHEQVAVSMADAEGRVTGKPGVAVVHAGPGFLNSLISVANAYKDVSPLLLISGAVKKKTRRTGFMARGAAERLSSQSSRPPIESTSR
ncbi:thiamine pyrophosphate-binding protein [Pyrobaculum sp. 3827-6]|uniref:thiamine pyrophosphate-binding protein n=1 Tax=Pyrobaculum sp. 3827-6 TaxID=2983604 RepID=UPI0021D95AFC|nr:thiamine pyrophosphate-binding protein [Pyrobaculum sp. 3827-6]MCU7787867.1 thiamine pyrophosphate-binding protein [Pyrobaculum sp. 3827-6]